MHHSIEYKTKTIKLPEDNIKENPYDSGLGKYILDTKTKTLSI